MFDMEFERALVEYQLHPELFILSEASGKKLLTTEPMKGMIVEKTVIDLTPSKLPKKEYFAVAFSVPNRYTTKYSLTHEGYITDWFQVRGIAELIQKKVSNEN